MQNNYSKSVTLKTLDISVIGFTLLIFVLTIIFHSKVVNWIGVAATFLAGAVGYYLLAAITEKISKPFWRIFSRS